MNSKQRRPDRKTLNPMGIGILHAGNCCTVKIPPITSPKKNTLYIDILNQSENGFCIRTTHLPMNEDMRFYVEFHDKQTQTWPIYYCKGVWIQENKGPSSVFLIGCQFHKTDLEQNWLHEDKKQNAPSPQDFSFIQQTRFFRSLDRGGLCPFLNSLNFSRISAGTQIITQGDPGDKCYLIQKGKGSVFVEKKGVRHRISRVKQGEIMGEMALLTGELRSASVVADTDMELWSIEKDKFDALTEKYPDVRNLLTELVSERFSNSNKTAERRVAKYLISNVIGSGGYAMVYEGKHDTLNMPVAIKMMKHDMAMKKEFLEKFRNEARMIAQFNHKNIVKVYDIEEQYQTVFIVMELLKGHSLESQMKECPALDYQKIVRILIQICSGLQYAHHKGIVHQDIKPANIFITRNKEVKILDFGLACPTFAENIDSLGSPYYMSPEQIELEAVDGRSDIYALGIMTYEMILGQRPYPEDNLLKLMDLHVEADIPDPWEQDKTIPKPLRDFIIKACCRDKENRYRDIEEALCQLSLLTPGFGPDPPNEHLDQKEVTSLFLFSQEAQKPEVKKLVEDFLKKAQCLGITVKAPGFDES